MVKKSDCLWNCFGCEISYWIVNFLINSCFLERLSKSDGKFFLNYMFIVFFLLNIIFCYGFRVNILKRIESVNKMLSYLIIVFSMFIVLI